jgi:MFS family permease
MARLLLDKEVLACVMACFQTFLAIGANGVIVAIHLTKSLQLSPSIVGLLISMMSLIFAFGAFLVPPVAQRIGYKLCLVFGLFSTTLSFMFLGPLPFIGDLVQSKTVTWILTVMYLVFYAFGIAFGDVPFVPMMKIILERKCMDTNLQINKQTISALISPLFNMCYACGMFVGPLIAGILMDKVPHRIEITCEESNRNICLSGTQWTTFILSSFSLLIGLYTAIAIRSDKSVRKQTTAMAS